MTETAAIHGSSGVEISDDQKYLYKIWHKWDAGPVACFCMLNPAYPTDSHRDPIPMLCEKYARASGCGGIEIVNLYARITVFMDVLRNGRDSVGARNDEVIVESAKAAGMFIAAWGWVDMARERIVVVERKLREAGVRALCLGTTMGGHPKFPVFAADDARPLPYIHAKDAS